MPYPPKIIDSTVFGSYHSPKGILKIPNGSDYSNWLTYLGSGWQVEYIQD